MACDNQLNKWEEYELLRREDKLDRLLRGVSLITFFLIECAATNIFFHRFFYYQQLNPRPYGDFRFSSVSIWLLIMGYAMLRLTYTFPRKGESWYQEKTVHSQIKWGLVFVITMAINYVTKPLMFDDLYIINIYHWVQTISYISIVVLNRLFIALIMKCKERAFQEPSERFKKIGVTLIQFSMIIYVVLAMFCSKFPKFFY